MSKYQQFVEITLSKTDHDEKEEEAGGHGVEVDCFVCFGLRARVECFVCWERVVHRERLKMKSRGKITNAAEEVWGQGMDSELLEGFASIRGKELSSPCPEERR